jgi:hypothetical protein
LFPRQHVSILSIPVNDAFVVRSCRRGSLPPPAFGCGPPTPDFGSSLRHSEPRTPHSIRSAFIRCLSLSFIIQHLSLSSASAVQLARGNFAETSHPQNFIFLDKFSHFCSRTFLSIFANTSSAPRTAQNLKICNHPLPAFLAS